MNNQKAKVKIAIVMGSDSDLPTMINAAKMLDEFRVGYEIDFVSAHRTPEKVSGLARSAADRGLCAIIAGAGGAAHLPGMLAAETVVPVIGVPIASKTIGGGGFNDALPSIVQMPPGVPVATVGVNRAENAAILALQILALSDADLRGLLIKYKSELNRIVQDKSKRLKEIGVEEYLRGME